MTDNDIIKALECCSSPQVNACDDCPFHERCYNNDEFIEKEAIDLINRQKAEIRSIDEHDNYVSGKVAALSVYIDKQEQEIERLKKLLDEEEKKYSLCAKRFFKEGVKEFAERLKSYLLPNHSHIMSVLSLEIVDNFAKEMVGENK